MQELAEGEDTEEAMEEPGPKEDLLASIGLPSSARLRKGIL